MAIGRIFPFCLDNLISLADASNSAGPAEQGGPGGPWPTHRSKMELPPTGV